MKRELGIARCGLACCFCSENMTCDGCDSGTCPDKDWCENRQCSISKKQNIVMSAMKNVERDYLVK